MSIDVLPLGSTYGSLYFAAILSTTFYGITLMQTFFYYVRYQNDLLPIKILVAILWILDTIHAALTVSGVFRYTLASLVNPSSLVTTNPELLFQYIPTALLAVMTQGFFIYRIYILSRQNIIPPIVWVVLALVELVCGTLYVIKAVYIDATGFGCLCFSATNLLSLWIIATITLSFAAGTDVLIANFMTFLLIREWITTDLASTAHILQSLVLFAVNTGIWTASFALLAVVLLYAFPTKVIYTVFSIPLGSIYCNTVLANLNARAYIWSDVATSTNTTELICAGSGRQVSKNTHCREMSVFSSTPQKLGPVVTVETTTL